MHDKALEIGTRIQLGVPVKNQETLLIVGLVVRVEFHAEEKYEIGVSVSLQELDKITRTEISKLLKQAS